MARLPWIFASNAISVRKHSPRTGSQADRIGSGLCATALELALVANGMIGGQSPPYKPAAIRRVIAHSHSGARHDLDERLVIVKIDVIITIDIHALAAGGHGPIVRTREAKLEEREVPKVDIVVAIEVTAR